MLDYNETSSKEELLSLLGDRCGMSAFVLLRTLNVPIRGAYVLKLIRIFSKKRYEEYERVYNIIFTHCSFYICAHLGNFLLNKILYDDICEIQYKAYINAGVYFSCSVRHSEQEKEWLIEEMEKRFKDYSPVLEGGVQEIAIHDVLINITRAIGFKCAGKINTVHFIRTAIEADPMWSLIHPLEFVDQYKKIKKNKVQ